MPEVQPVMAMVVPSMLVMLSRYAGQ